MAKTSLSSLPLAMLLWFNGVWTALFAVASVALMIYKAVELPYPSGLYGWEIVFYIVFAAVDYVALSLGKRGNRTATLLPLLGFLGLSAGLAVCLVYFLYWQVYVLRADVVLSAIGLGFVALELPFALLVLARMVRNRAA